MKVNCDLKITLFKSQFTFTIHPLYDSRYVVILHSDSKKAITIIKIVAK